MKVSQRPRLRSVPISALRMQSPSEMMPTAGRIDNGQAADLMAQHDGNRIRYGSGNAYRDNLPRHHLARKHRHRSPRVER
jgi:hypothetical protein